MHKKLFIFGLVLAMLGISQTTVAQKNATVDEAIRMAGGNKFLDKNKTWSKPISQWVIDGQGYQLDPAKAKATLEVINFGTDGNTIILNVDNNDPNDLVHSSYSWSGHSVHLAPISEGDYAGLFVMRSDAVCAALLYKFNKWIAVTNSGEGIFTISDIKKGMGRSDLQNILSTLGLSQFKFTRNSGNLKVYSLFWLTNEKRYNFFGTDYKYVMRNDKKYGDFYFDAQGKLVKWLLFF